ncbi:MAG TPA: 23S rRNA (guanosine(2251)-2'-O)-methyltransferase RlmB, partial [Thermoanaerobaculia bacterium]|nr:23S rRNA (guanosine(2251)-2'-O)-methyltransferase RlmB [Thermoanaerobaculia bacterium]
RGGLTSTDLIWGYHPVREALRHHPEAVVRVLIAAHRKGRRREEIVALCKRAGVAWQSLAGPELDRMAPGVHNGFLAQIHDTEETKRRIEAVGDPDFLLLAEDIQDPRNLGALIRVADGAGVGRLLLRDRGSAPLSALAVKASAGAAETLPIERIVNSARIIEESKKEGFWVYGAVPGGEEPWQIDWKGKVLLCIGGEERGLRQRTKALCDRLVGLPMRGSVESLNVATAAAAILYEALRQRLGGAS